MSHATSKVRRCCCSLLLSLPAVRRVLLLSSCVAAVALLLCCSAGGGEEGLRAGGDRPLHAWRSAGAHAARTGHACMRAERTCMQCKHATHTCTCACVHARACVRAHTSVRRHARTHACTRAVCACLLQCHLLLLLWRAAGRWGGWHAEQLRWRPLLTLQTDVAGPAPEGTGPAGVCKAEKAAEKGV